MKLYLVPEGLRPALSRGYGVVVRGSDPLDVAARVSQIMGRRRAWCVGDVVVASLVRIGRIPEVAFVDGLTLRERGPDLAPIVEAYRGEEVLRISNPRGFLSSQAIDAVKAISPTRGRRFLVIVEGEEDMISLAVAALAPLGDVLAYGLPRVGVSVVEIDQNVRELAESLLKQILDPRPEENRPEQPSCREDGKGAADPPKRSRQGS